MHCVTLGTVYMYFVEHTVYARLPIFPSLYLYIKKRLHSITDSVCIIKGRKKIPKQVNIVFICGLCRGLKMQRTVSYSNYLFTTFLQGCLKV